MAFYFYLSTKIIMVFITKSYQDLFGVRSYINAKDKVVNSFGVQDDFLYQYALPILNKRAEERQPFFTVLLSISNHPSYVILTISNHTAQSLKIRLWNTRTGPSGNSCKKHANNPGLKIQSLFCWVTMGNW